MIHLRKCVWKDHHGDGEERRQAGEDDVTQRPVSAISRRIVHTSMSISHPFVPLKPSNISVLSVLSLCLIDALQ